jgi:predicted Fe-Mo cluster-binding NifX family protein
MRIAVPMTGGQFSPHFGQSAAFWICDAQQTPPGISNGRELPLPVGGGCRAIPALLAEAGVQVVIAGGIGAGAVQGLARFGIETVAGVAPASPQQLAMDYLAGRLTSSGQTCQQHEAHHRHTHGQGGGGGCHRHEDDPMRRSHTEPAR